jgi:cytochrome c1
MDESEMFERIDRVLSPYIGQQQQYGVSCLILDECWSHLIRAVKKDFQACYTEVDYIPGGYTSKCHSIDDEINKLLINYVTTAFNTWLTATGNNKPCCQDVANWINAPWKNISISTIKSVLRNVESSMKTKKRKTMRLMKREIIPMMLH